MAELHLGCLISFGWETRPAATHFRPSRYLVDEACGREETACC